MNPVDPLRKSRMIQVIRQYVKDGWLNKSALSNINRATEGDLDALIDRGRARKEEAEGESGGEEGPASGESIEEQAAREIRENSVPVAQPPPASSMPEPVQQEGEPVSEENQIISEQEFFDKFPKGTHIEYDGEEYVVTKHEKAHQGVSPHLLTVGINTGEVVLTLQEFHDGEFNLHPQPTKIPQIAEYPPQVFLFSYDDEGKPNASIHLNHQDLAAAYPSIEGDQIMEAISDPGQPIEVSGGTLIYTSIGG